MKKKVKFILVVLFLGIAMSSCAIFGEREQCPAYTQVEIIETAMIC